MRILKRKKMSQELSPCAVRPLATVWPWKLSLSTSSSSTSPVAETASCPWNSTQLLLGSTSEAPSTYRVWQVFLGAHQALDDLCPAAVAQVACRCVMRWTVLQGVSAGHDLALDGGAHQRAQHLHGHPWGRSRRRKIQCRVPHFRSTLIVRRGSYCRRWPSLSPSGQCSGTWWGQNKAHGSTAKTHVTLELTCTNTSLILNW